jgi:hypothetical protein
VREELTEYTTKKDMRQIMEEVVDEKLRPPNRCALLLGFAAFSEQATEAAIERLAGALRCPLNRGSGMSDRRSCFLTRSRHLRPATLTIPLQHC